MIPKNINLPAIKDILKPKKVPESTNTPEMCEVCIRGPQEMILAIMGRDYYEPEEASRDAQ